MAAVTRGGGLATVTRGEELAFHPSLAGCHVSASVHPLHLHQSHESQELRRAFVGADADSMGRSAIQAPLSLSCRGRRSLTAVAGRGSGPQCSFSVAMQWSPVNKGASNVSRRGYSVVRGGSIARCGCHRRKLNAKGSDCERSETLANIMSFDVQRAQIRCRLQAGAQSRQQRECLFSEFSGLRCSSRNCLGERRSYYSYCFPKCQRRPTRTAAASHSQSPPSSSSSSPSSSSFSPSPSSSASVPSSPSEIQPGEEPSSSSSSQAPPFPAASQSHSSSLLSSGVLSWWPLRQRKSTRGEEYINYFLQLARARTLFSDALQAFFRSELRRRAFVTVALIVLSRVGHFIPVPGFDRRLMPRDFLDVVSGVVEEFGDLNSSLVLNIFQLGMSPYIMSSIIMQVLCLVVPYFVRARKEGMDGQDTIKWYTGVIAMGIAVVQSLVIAGMSIQFSMYAESRRFVYFLVTCSYLTLGAWVLHKISDQITLAGFGSGSSVIISISILRGYADSLSVLTRNMQRNGGFTEGSSFLLFLLFFLLMTAGAVFVIEGRRKVPMVYFQGEGRSSRSHLSSSSLQSVVGDSDSDAYIPFNINPEGMQPVLLATYLLSVPALLASATQNPSAILVRDVLNPVKGGPWLYYSCSFLLIFVMNQLDFMDMPKEMAEYLTKIGARVPGVRPGVATVKHLRFVHASARFWGGLLLALLTTVSGLVDQRYRATYPGLTIGFTSMLIIVGSIIQTKHAVVAYQQMPKLQKVLRKYRV